MVTHIPSQGIESYMNAQARNLTPPNRVWLIRNWFTNGRGLWPLIIAAFIIGLGPEVLPANLLWVPHYLSALLLPAVVIYFTFTVIGRAPGTWNRYPVFQCIQKHPTMTSALLHEISTIRQVEQDAEFEIAVLEQRSEYFGAVLFQVLGKTALNASSADSKVGVPVRVFSQQQNTIQFGEAQNTSFAF